MSSVGVMESKHVRVFGDNSESPFLRKFIKDTPIVPAEIEKSCNLLISNLQSTGVILQVSLQDVLAEVSKRVLSTEELIACLQYWVSFRSNFSINALELASFLNAVLVSVHGSSPIPLAKINYFINPKLITPGVPLPPDTLPLEISKNFSKEQLENSFG